MGCFSLKFEDFLTMTKEICITKPNLGNNCLIVFTLHLEKWILHRLLQLYAYRDLLKNLFANSVVFFRIFQWTTSKFYSQPTSYVRISCERKKCVPASVCQPQHRQSAMHSLQSSELGPTPLTHRRGCPPSPPRFWREGYTHWRERGWGGGPNTDEGTDTVLL